MLLTLLLTENTPIAFAALFLLAPLVLALYFPIFWLSRPKSSQTAKTVAFGLALLLLWAGSAFSSEPGGMVTLFFYLPFVVVFVNLVRSLFKE